MHAADSRIIEAATCTKPGSCHRSGHLRFEVTVPNSLGRTTSSPCTFLSSHSQSWTRPRPLGRRVA